ncbi:MAG: DUF739 family protein [Candidatus Brocadiaceae bacterium]
MIDKDNELKEEFDYLLHNSELDPPTQQNFAMALNVSAATVTRWLNGKIEWRSSDFRRACDLLELDEEKRVHLRELVSAQRKKYRDSQSTGPNTLSSSNVQKNNKANKIPRKPDMMLIRAGRFWMGSDPKKYSRDFQLNPTEQPYVKVYLPNYELSKTPITNAQYADFLQKKKDKQPPPHWKNKREPPPGLEDHPVVNINFEDALDYCKWLGSTYELPTEAEWEKGARGTEGLIYPWGDEWKESHCNYGVGKMGGTTPVDKYRDYGISPYDLLDMSGNVWEWTCSTLKLYPSDPEKEPEKNPADNRNLDPNDKEPRVIRGGSFNSPLQDVRCAVRRTHNPNDKRSFIGFRVKKRL